MEKYNLPFGTKETLTAKEEIKLYKIEEEYDMLSKMLNSRRYWRNDEKTLKYNIARHKILEYIKNCVEKDNIYGDYYNVENWQNIIEAGCLLHMENGEKSMKDGLVWKYIPKRYYSDINYLWNGIGDWKC